MGSCSLSNRAERSSNEKFCFHTLWTTGFSDCFQRWDCFSVNVLWSIWSGEWMHFSVCWTTSCITACRHLGTYVSDTPCWYKFSLLSDSFKMFLGVLAQKWHANAKTIQWLDYSLSEKCVRVFEKEV